MSRLRWVGSIVGLALLLAALGWMFWPRPPMVDAIEIRRAPASRILAVNGTIRPRLSVDVKSPLGGTLTALAYDVGDRVEEGALLARVDDAPQRAAIAEAEAAVTAQQATLAQARRDLARFVALGQFVTRQRREQARLEVDRGSQELRRLRAAVVQARELQRRLELRAPFGGVILDRPVDPGQTIGIETVLYRLADLAAPEVTAEVDEVYATELRPGTAAVIALPGSASTFRGSVVHIEPRVDPATGARAIRLRVAEPLVHVAAGLTVSVNLVVDHQESAISIPRNAILQPDSNPRVRMVNSAGMVSERPVRFLDWPAATVTVTQGLAPGMRILADPQAAAPGAHVRVNR